MEIWRGYPSPSEEGVWPVVGERRDLPQRGKKNLVHFIRYRSLLVEEKSNLFMDNYFGTNEPTIPRIS